MCGLHHTLYMQATLAFCIDWVAMMNNQIKALLSDLKDEDILQICELPRQTVIYLVDNNLLELELQKHLLTALKSWHSARNRANILERIKLLPDRKIKNKILLMFSMLERINCILKSSDQLIDTYAKAKLYMLTKFKDVLVILDNEYKDVFVEQINQFILYWLMHRNAPMKIQVRGKLLLKNNSHFLIIDGLEKVRLEELNTNQIKLLNNCATVTLLKSNNELYIELDKFQCVNKEKRVTTYEKREKNQRSHVKKQRNNNKQAQRKKQDSINSTYTLKRLEKYLRFIDRVNRAFVKSDFDKLQGWHTQGGLPSLGKKR